MSTIKVLDKEFKLYIKQEEIESVINDIANQINEEYKDKNPLFLVMLNGAFMFASQLFKELTIDCETSFVKYSTYSGTQSTCEVKELIGLNSNLKGRNVIIVEDIIDSGRTLSHLVKLLSQREPASLQLCTLLDKPDRRVVEVDVKYVGFEIPDKFVVGYGLDYDQKMRNLPYIGEVVFEQ